MELIKIADYPELQLLTWDIHCEFITRERAWLIYDRKYSYIYLDLLTENELQFIKSLQNEFGEFL